MTSGYPINSFRFKRNGRASSIQCFKGTLFAVVLLFAFMIGCSPSIESPESCVSCDLQVVKSELHALDSDLQVWRVLMGQETVDPVLEETVVTAILKHILTVRAAEFRVEDLPGLPLEALCYATTSEFRTIVDSHSNEKMKAIVLEYLEGITPEVVSHVQEVQANMLGSGCSLTPAR